MVLVRQEIGDVLRDFRLQKAMTLRQVARRASVALGYLSEVERGQKEASSEILASVADALDTPISVIMREVGDRLAVVEGVDLHDAARRSSPTRSPTSWSRSSTRTSRSADAASARGLDLCARGCMKLSEFTRAVAEEFGAFGRVLLRDTVVVELGNRTPEQALAAGMPARDVWLALCRVAGGPAAALARRRPADAAARLSRRSATRRARSLEHSFGFA